MKLLSTLALTIFFTACSHPLEIVGEGDITSSTGTNDCALEAQPCANYIIGDYDVSYTAAPRAGWFFSRWEGCGAQFPDCYFNVSSSTVTDFLGQTMPPLRAVFTQDPALPSFETATHWSAVNATLTIDVTFSNFTPTSVRLFPHGADSGWVEEDTSAPFSFTLAVTALEPGDHEILISANNATTFIEDSALITVSGCNGAHDLCDRSYDKVRYATTHNAMSNSTDGWFGPNQSLDVPAQLAVGVRGLMLDVHRAGNTNLLSQIQVPNVDPDTSYLCHSVCALGRQRLDDGLREIRVFLDENPGAVVTLILESYLSHALTADAFNAANLTPYAYLHEGGSWPTLGEMIDAGTRLVVLQDKSVNAAYPWLMNVWSHAFETHYSASAPNDFSCVDNRGTPANDLFIFNHFLTDTFGSRALAEQVNHNPLLANRIDACETFHGSVATFVTVDFVDIGDTLSTIEALNAPSDF